VNCPDWRRPFKGYFPAADREQTDQMHPEHSVPLSTQVIFFGAEKPTANQQWRYFS
jgi:hypothetical protein